MKFNINGNEVEIKDEDLTKAIEEKKESFDLKIEDVVIRSTEEEATFKENTEKAAQVVGMEIGRKNLLKGFGIEVDGAHKEESKSIEAFTSHITSKVASELESAKIAPDKKVEELQKDKEQLILNNTSLQDQFDNFKKDSVVKDQNQKRINTLSGLIPENTINTREDTLTLMNARLNTGFNEKGVMFGIGEDGEPMKNTKTMELLPMKEVVSNFFDNNKSLLKGSSGGANGGDSTGGDNKQTLVEFVEETSKDNIAPNSTAFNTLMIERQKAGLLET